MPGKIRTKLTHYYAKPRGGVTDTGVYSASGVSRTVFWYSNDGNRVGDYSPFGTLLMNERIKDNFSKDAVDYVFLHEVGHDQTGWVGRTLFTLAYVVFGFLFLGGIIALPAVFILSILAAPSVTALIGYSIGVVIAAIIVLSPFIAVCWIDETMAELYAISKLGWSRYQSIQRELESVPDPGFLQRVRKRVQYPPDTVIIWLVSRYTKSKQLPQRSTNRRK